jgi:hypothetical protein
MSSDLTSEKAVNSEIGQVSSPPAEKTSDEEQHLEHVKPSSVNLEYNDDEEEPEIHARTYVALAAMFLLNLVQVVALQGPPAIVGFQSERGRDECLTISSAARLHWKRSRQ